MSRAQLRAVGFGDSSIDQWVQRGLLIRCLPKVYAFGHTAPSRESRLWEAILYAGPGAMLSHLTAAQWCGFLKYGPAAVHVSTPRKIASLPGVVVHARRELQRASWRGVPVTTVTQTLFDLATVRPELLELVLSQLDYMELLDAAAIDAQMGHGVRGTAELRHALTSYDPNYARLNDAFEIDFYAKCREWGIDPLPVPNVEVAPRLRVDGLWPDHGLGVELDGKRNHHSDAQLLRDAERDLICRELGLTIIRYRRAQLLRSPGRIRADLVRELAGRAPRPAG